ncbi:hypothetical protein TWF506_004991 [Arthrobotrys conoides]|uniref:Uncharacterized protein n=1 Tax=Arthrobotrys conoides TaxID=74498 RepID=A0AAN8RZL9_9PEZI
MDPTRTSPPYSPIPPFTDPAPRLYLYDTDDPDLQELGLHPLEVEPSESEDSYYMRGQTDRENFVNVSICRVDPILDLLVRDFNRLNQCPSINVNVSSDKSLEITIPNVWHFSIQFIHLAPPHGTQRVLCIWLPASNYIAPLAPLRYLGDDDYAPEEVVSPAVKAAAIVPQILRTFLRLGYQEKNKDWNVLQPWKLMNTRDPELAVAVGDLFMRSGVSESLWHIHNASPEVSERAERCFRLYENKIYKMLGIEIVDSGPMDLDELDFPLETTQGFSIGGQKGVSGTQEGATADQEATSSKPKESTEEQEKATTEETKVTEGARQGATGLRRSTRKLSKAHSEPPERQAASAADAPTGRNLRSRKKQRTL